MNKQLLDEMQNAVKETVSDKKVGVAFSGGVDSTMLAKLVKDISIIRQGGLDISDHAPVVLDIDL